MEAVSWQRLTDKPLTAGHPGGLARPVLSQGAPPPRAPLDTPGSVIHTEFGLMETRCWLGPTQGLQESSEVDSTQG